MEICSVKLFSFIEHRKKTLKVCSDHDYCYLEMSNEGSKILKCNYGENSMKAPFMIYADLECLLEKMHSCWNNPEKSYTEKKTKLTRSGYSLFTNCSFDATKSKLDCYKEKDRMEKFCKDLESMQWKQLTMKKRNGTAN